jgi:hypothetical protein
MGTRKEVAEHELLCQNIPIEVLITKLEDTERTKKELEETVLNLRNEILHRQQRESAAVYVHRRNLFFSERRKKKLEERVSQLEEQIHILCTSA